jgi:hypothetical protein
MVLHRRFLLSLVVALSLSTLAFANSAAVNMTFLYPGTNVSGGYYTYPDAAVQALDSNALFLAKHAPANEFKGLVLYTAVGGTPGHGPQEFIGYRGTPLATPEPGSLLLLSTGLIGIAGLLRRNLVRA